MSSWVIVVDRLKDFPNADTPHKVITAKDYLSRPQLFSEQRPKIINLARSFAYQGAGYYCSLLAEARGHRVLPSVETILDLSRASLYRNAVPEIEAALNRCVEKLPEKPAGTLRLLVCFGAADQPGYGDFARLLFDWYRAPVVEVTASVGKWVAIKRIRLMPLTALTPEEGAFLRDRLTAHTRGQWRSPRARTPAKWSLAVLHDPQEALPPSDTRTLKHFARLAEKRGVEVEPITKRDLTRLAEYDALFIRETTSIDNHTYRFARRAVQEGMPVIDDPVSIMRCANKVYLAEVLRARKIPTPRTLIVDDVKETARIEAELAYPVVVKIPDGSFSRGVKKAANREELQALLGQMLEDSDLILVQEFMPTEFDWRVGVLDGEPLFVCQYLMAKKHWQIVRHDPDGKAHEGGFRTFAVEDAPAEVVETATKAARLMGRGLYGVDLKQNDKGVFVIEINDNPNLDHGVEDAVAKDAVWNRLLDWFLARLERR